jgi:hypothetical protein
MMAIQAHCSAKGSEYAQWLCRREVAAVTQFASKAPMTKQRLMKADRWPRKAVGQTSEAYAGAMTTNEPSTRPARSSPTSRVGRERARNWTRTTAAVAATQAANVALRPWMSMG